MRGVLPQTAWKTGIEVQVKKEIESYRKSQMALRSTSFQVLLDFVFNCTSGLANYTEVKRGKS
jgi:hypothetical protein